MNSYFASVEQYLSPELRKVPVAVVPLDSDFTSVIAASYDAKRRGVRVGTLVKEAKTLCPGIQIVRARPDLYVQIHRKILKTVEQVAPIHKVYSIDEWAIQLRGPDRNPIQANQLALEIKSIMAATYDEQLPCSIGIAPTRLLAKVGSGLQKPNGLTLLPTEEVLQKLEHEPLESLCGIGVGMLLRLHQHRVFHFRDLWNLTKQQASKIWGSINGARWWNGIHGIDEPEIPTKSRSMSHSNVLDPQYRHEKGAYGILLRLICRLACRLRLKGYFANCLQLHLRNQNGEDYQDSILIPCTNDTPTIVRSFQTLWRRRPHISKSIPIKKVGVTVSDLVLASQVTPSLFGEIEKLQRVSKAMDEINSAWGGGAVYLGALHEFRHRMDNKIAFGRIPEESLIA